MLTLRDCCNASISKALAFSLALLSCSTLLAEESPLTHPERGEVVEPVFESDTKAAAVPIAQPRSADQVEVGDPVPPAPKTPEATPGLQDDKGIFLSLEDCIEIAVQNNLGLRISRLEDRRSDLAVRIAWSRFYPEFSLGFLHENRRQVGSRSDDPDFTYNAGIAQELPWGTRLDFAMTETRSRFDDNSASGQTRARVTQPLWRGAGTDVGLAQVRTARIRRLISRGTLELDLQNLIFQVRSNYANVIRQLQNREVNRQAVRSAKTFLDLTAAREQAGQVTKLDVFNAEVQLRSRELALLSNERQLETALDQLKQIMDVDLEESIRVDALAVDFGERAEPNTVKELRPDEVSGTVSLVITRVDRPVEMKLLFQATHFDEKVLLAEALQNRIELLNGYRNIAIQKLQTLLARDGLGYELNLVGAFTREHNARSFFESENGLEVNDWSVGLNAVIPWGKIRDKADYEAALLDLQRAQISLKQVRTTVHFEVRDITRRLREAERSLLIEARRVEQAKRSVEAAQISFDRGLKDSFDVIRAEDDLLQAKTDFINRRLEYVIRLAELEVVVGKPTGRVDLSGQSIGGIVSSRLPMELLSRGLPKPMPEPEARPESDPLNNSRDYRKDYKANKTSPVACPPATVPAPEAAPANTPAPAPTSEAQK